MIYWNFFPLVTHILTTQNIYMFLTFDILSWNPSLFLWIMRLCCRVPWFWHQYYDEYTEAEWMKQQFVDQSEKVQFHYCQLGIHQSIDTKVEELHTLCSLVRWPAATNNNCNYDSFCSRSTSQVIIIYKGPFTSPPSIMVAIATNILNDGSYAALTSPGFIWILLFYFGILPHEHFCKWPKILFIYLITKCVTWFQK